MPSLIEVDVEAVLIDHLGRLGYACLNDAVSVPDGAAPEREAYGPSFRLNRAAAAHDRHADP